MTKSEMQIFIEEMEEIGDIWTMDEVNNCYADISLEEALKTRKSEVGLFLSGFGQVVSYLTSKDD